MGGQSHARQFQRFEELPNSFVELVEGDSLLDRHDVRPEHPAMAFVRLTDIDDKRNRIIRIVDAMQFVDTPSEEAHMLREKPLLLSCIDQDRISLTINPPDALDAGLEPEPQNLGRLYRMAVPAPPTAEVLLEKTHDVLDAVVLPVLLVGAELRRDERLGRVRVQRSQRS